VTVQEWKELVRAVVHGGDAPDSILVAVGPTGIGKSAVVRQVAMEEGIEYQDVWFSQLEGPGDYLGRTFTEDRKEGEREYKITRFAVPSYFPVSGAGILSLEEVFSTPPDLVEAFKSLVSYRSLGDWVCPPDWRMVGTTNPYEGEDGAKYNTFEVDLAVRQRIIILPVEASYDEWMEWARDEHLHDGTLSFIEADQSRWHQAPPRTWKQLSDWTFKIPPERLAPIAIACIGDTLGVSYVKHVLQDDGLRPFTLLDILENSDEAVSAIGNLLADGRLDLITATTDNIIDGINSGVIAEWVSNGKSLNEAADRLCPVIVELPLEQFGAVYRSIFDGGESAPGFYEVVAERDDISSKIDGCY